MKRFFVIIKREELKFWFDSLGMDEFGTSLDRYKMTIKSCLESFMLRIVVAQGSWLNRCLQSLIFRLRIDKPLYFVNLKVRSLHLDSTFNETKPDYWFMFSARQAVQFWNYDSALQVRNSNLSNWIIEVANRSCESR